VIGRPRTGFRDAEAEAQRQLDDALKEATSLRAEAQSLMEQAKMAAADERLAAEEKVKDIHDQADARLNQAIRDAGRIMAQAEERAEQIGGDAYDQALQRFYRRWKEEALVMNKWFALQAVSPSPETLARVNELTEHPLFSVKNPNRVRSVYGAFAHGNQVRFNDASGKGYDFIANAAIEIDGFNPQIASRLVGAFESWRIFEPKRRALALAALQRVLARKSLSPDVFEIASKIVGADASAIAA